MTSRPSLSILLLLAMLLLCAPVLAGAASLSDMDYIYMTTPHTLLPVGEELTFTMHTSGAALSEYSITAAFMRKPIDDTGRTYTYYAPGAVSGDQISVTLADEGRYLCQLTLQDGSGGSSTLFAGYYVTESDASSQLSKAISDVKAKCLAAGASTATEKARFVHDYIISNASYNTSAARKDDPEGVLLDGAGVCQSYAYAYQLIMKELGVECVLIEGTINGEDHIWNLIRVGGKWYHVDCTADDPIGGSENDMFFMVPDEVCVTNHTWDRNHYPACEDRLEETGKPTEKDGFTFNAGYGNITIQSYTGTAANLVVPAEINGRRVTSVSKYFLQNNSDIKTVTFSEGIEQISSLFASHCRSLTSISIPSTARLPLSETGVVSGLGGLVDHCDNVKTITVAEGNPQLCVVDNVLYNKAKTTLLFYPPQSRAAVLHVPEGIRKIQDDAFSGNVYLQEVVLPDSVEEIGYWAFSGCTALEKANIPKNCEFIGQYAFQTTNLARVHIPAATTAIMPTAFPGTLQTITAEEGNPVYYAKDNVLFSRDGMLLCYAGRKPDTTYTVPSGVSVIAMNAFQNAKNLRTISLPDGLTKIDNDAFFRCESLTQVTIPDTVTTIEGRAFMDCIRLAKLTIPASVTSIGDGLLNNVKGTVIYGEAGSAAQTWANQNGYIFHDIHAEWAVSGSCGSNITWTLTENGRLTLTGKGKMEAQSVYPWAAYATVIKTLVVSNGITSIADGAFGNACHYGNLTSVSLPESLTAIGTGAFSRVDSLRRLVIPDGVVSIGDGAFTQCEKLEAITIPNSVTKIGWRPFDYCPKLVIYCSKGSAILTYAQNNNIPYKLNSTVKTPILTLPAFLTVIEEEAFCGIAAEEIVLSEGVTSIGARAFADCLNLTRITLPDSVTEIAPDAFAGSDSVCILCSEGSYAKAFAVQNGIAYEAE